MVERDSQAYGQELEYARKDFQNALVILCSRRGINLGDVLTYNHQLDIYIKFGNMETVSLPGTVKKWVSGFYQPRATAVDEIVLMASYNKAYQGGIVNIDTSRINLSGEIKVALVGQNTPEAAEASQSPIVVPDDDVLGLPVIHSVAQAEAMKGWKGIVLPDQGLVVGESIMLFIEQNLLTWKRSWISMNDWANDRHEKYETETGILSVDIVRDLAAYLLDISSEGKMYDVGEGVLRRSVSPPRITLGIY